MDGGSAERVLVVGASAGIGAATMEALTAAGIAAAGAARRGPIMLDVRFPRSCESAVEAAVDQLGGLDAVVYAAGVNHLARLDATEASTWEELFETNVIGAALVLRAALPHLRAAGGRVVVCGSHAVPDPWPWLGAYLTSKAALEALVECFRVEEPEVAWCRLVVGPTLTGMADAWDPELMGQAFAQWADEGRLDGIEPVEASVVATRIVELLTAAELPRVDSMLAAH